MPAGVPATISKVSPVQAEIAGPGQQFPSALQVQVLDSNGNGVSGVTVTFQVNPDPTTGAQASIAGGNTAVTNGSGVATSGTLTASGLNGPGVRAGNFTVSASGGGLGPVNFGFAILLPGVYSDIAAIQTAWTTFKTHQSSFLTDLGNLITDLTNMEADRDALYLLGAGDVSDWIQQFIQRVRLGYQPRLSASGGPPAQVALVQAPNPNIARDTTAAAQPLISQTTTGQICNLS